MCKRLINNIDDLLKSIEEISTDRETILIAIDGLDDVGKTTIARSISDMILVKYVSVDDYLHLHTEGYLNNVKFEILHKEIVESVKIKSLIIEGVCILEVLNRIRVTPDIHIYVKKPPYLNSTGDTVFDYLSTIEDLLKAEDEDHSNLFRADNENENRFVDKVDFSKEEYISEESVENIENHGISLNEGLSYELLLYHFNYKPDLNADILYENTTQCT